MALTSTLPWRIAALAAIGLLAACGSSASPTSGAATAVESSTPITSAPSTTSTTGPAETTAASSATTDASPTTTVHTGLPVIADQDPRYLYSIVTGAGGGVLVTRLDGSDPVRLGTDVNGVLKHARWSPDGQHVVFVDETKNEIWIAHLDGSPSTKVPGCEANNCDYPSFSPDGTKLAFSRWTNGAAVGPAAVGVAVIDLGTAAITEVVTLQRPLLADVPIWLPDGKNLAIGVDQMNDNADETGSAVAIVPTSGGELRYLTDFQMFGYAPVPSPTTGEIVFGTPFAAEDATWNVYAIEPDGTGLRQITHAAPGEHIRGPKWTPDGSMLLANSSSQGHIMIDPTSGAITPIANTPKDTTSPHLRP